ncbi:MAG TPA: TerB family tellurite resistance protein [Sandaracinaceae bacterium LLY-WYZ-13_1]|nr:TerB family tellurite resistance protein [Sandaracinaceae bacterium LLY-WYZ-13_1]
MVFFRRRKSRAPVTEPTVDEVLLSIARDHMPDTSEDEVRIVAAVAGLVGCVAYADGHYGPDESREVEALLGRVHDLPRAAVNAICALLDERIAELARGEVHEHARVLKAGTEREARLEMLDVLMDLAAADGVITVDETELLRRVAKLMGLSTDEYVAAQARHRDKLSVLR